MLDVMNRYAHGFVAVPVVLACRAGGVIERLQSGPQGAEGLATAVGANLGHLLVALRLLESLGWIDRDAEGRFVAAPQLEDHRRIPDSVRALVEFDFDAYLAGNESPGLAAWIDQVDARWGVGPGLIGDFLDSLLVVPLLVLLARRNLLDAGLCTTRFAALPVEARHEVERLFATLGWVTVEPAPSLTPMGEFMFERAMNLGVVESYRPMLRSLDQLLFGDARGVLAEDSAGRERHVDRSTNVISSGFQHDRYFAEVEAAIVAIFSREPMSSQPRYVADMGCGDGAFLKRVYETVRDKTPRGRQLEEFPLTLIGIDLSQAALDETRRTLAGIDHIVLSGDIGDPARLVRDLEALGVDTNAVLHIRSFLDHDRPYRAPENVEGLAARARGRYHGVYVDDDGRAIPPAAVVQSLVEHLERWASIVNDHGLILLEVHCLDPLVVREHLDQSESLYFDAIQGFSKQLLVEADVALMAAAEAGLFPKRDFFRKFPEILPYCRITLNLFERRPYRVRPARRNDVPALLRLEEACWEEGMRVSGDELERRIERYPLGQYVLELDGDVVGVVYTQRIADVDQLRACRFTEIAALHDDTGSVVQLVTINVLPEMQHMGLGHELLDLMLLRSRLQGGIRRAAGITRCKDFRGGSLAELAGYVDQRDAEGRPIDPILRFHHAHGARFCGLVEGYRPEDADNLGAGVLLVYDFESSLASSGLEHIDRPREAGGAVDLEAALRRLLGPKREGAFAWSKPLRDMGLDSLDLLEFRTLLGRMFSRPFPPTFFFSYPTLADIRRYLEADAAIDEPQAVRLEHAPAARTQEVSAALSRQAVAVVGMAVRFPGAANLDEFLSLLEEGRDPIGEFPAERWRSDERRSADFGGPDWVTARNGGFLSGIDEFDASFFNISPREAELMDPQQRLLMELHWEALEHAAIDPSSLCEKSCGIFVGLYTHDYETLQVLGGAEEDLDIHFATGTAASIAAGRLAYFLGTRGPAVTLDTACSSSLVAVHMAMRSLRAGECDVALASGVNLILSPRLSIAFARAGMLSPRGRCRTFDASADGYVRSEGCGVVVLKRLDDALAAGDRVLAVLRGSAVNQDGASNGLTAPSLPAQEALLRAALADADLVPADIDYLEAHGTGTGLGDPVEFHAIRNVFGGDASRRRPLWLASVKTNIGHTEAAAGIAGLVKVVLSMQRRSLMPHLHFETPNPLIDLESLPACVPVDLTEWQSETGLRRAGVSSFGFSGTNAHVVVEEYPALAHVATDPDPSRRPLPQLLPISAKSAPALGALLDRYAEWIERHPDVALEDVCYTAAVGRAHHDHRIALRAETREALAAELSRARTRAAASRRIAAPPKVAFLFTGQGSQYPGMARELALEEPAFRAALHECSEILAGELDIRLEDLLYREPVASRALDETANTQPALFAVEYALARMLEAWGIEPSILIGHSVGEYVAACIAKVFSLEDALRLIAARGRLMGALPRVGGMLAVLGPAEAVVRKLDGCAGEVAIAAYNGPENVVLSGRREHLESLGAELESAGFRTVALQVSHAFHSPLMEPMLDAFAEEARRIRYAAPRIAIVSNVTGVIATDAIATPEYWVRHVCEPVRFEQGIRAVADSGARVMLEVGPHPVLTGMGKACFRDASADLEWLATLSRDAHPWANLTETLAVLYEMGVPVKFRAAYASRPRRRIALPSYPWQRERYWFALARPGSVRREGRASVWDRQIEPAVEGGSWCWETEMTSSHPTGVGDHRVGGVVAMPGAGILVLALAAAREAFGAGTHSIEQLELVDVLALGESPRRVQLALTPTLPGTLELRVASRSGDDDWQLHARGHLLLGEPDVCAPDTDANPLGAAAHVLDRDAFYEQMSQRGLDYGPRFRVVRELRHDGTRVVASLSTTETLRWASAENLPVDVADACLQVLIALAPTDGTAWVPIAVERFTVHTGLDDGGDVVVQGLRVAQDRATFTANARVLASSGREIAVFEGVRFKRVDARSERALDEWFFEIDWVPVRREADESSGLVDFPTPASLATRLSSVRARTAQQDARTEPLVAELDVLCGKFVAAALARLGLRWRRGNRLAAGTLAETLGIAERHERLLGRLLEMLEQDGLLARDGDDWLVTDVPSEEDPGTALRALRTRFPAFGVELDLLGRCVGSLDEVLADRCDPLQLLFPQGSLDHAGRLYQDSMFSRACNAMIRDAVEAAAASLAPDRTLRVLEIGAGTGGTTAHLLPLLDKDRTRYVFTDVSPLFTARAAEKFRDYPFVEYRLLDIAMPASEQGFGYGEFDVVVAANVLHATPDLSATVREARKLLAPGGKLMLIEGIRPARWIDLIFGMTEGWWAFRDSSLRPAHPLVSAEGWARLLRESGYEEPVVVSNADPETGTLFEQAVIVAGRPAREAGRDAGTWIVFQDAAGTGERLRSALLERGARVLSVVSADDPRAGEDSVHVVRPQVAEDYAAVVADLVKRSEATTCGIAYLWPLDVTDAMTPAESQVLTCEAPTHIVRALAAVEAAPPRLWLVTRGTQPAGETPVATALAAQVWGIGRVIALEHPELRCAIVDLDPSIVDGGDDASREAVELAAELCGLGRAAQVCLRGSGRYEARLVHAGPLRRASAASRLALPRPHAYRLSVDKPGTLDALRYRSAARRRPARGEVEIRVRASGLNFRDVLLVLGMIPDEAVRLGYDVCGTITRVGEGVDSFAVGDEVIALATDTHAAFVYVRAELVARRPSRLSAEEAAGVPVAFVTAAHALENLAHVEPGQRVLIHAATGGVGMAAVQVAKLRGCEIFATAGSPSKRRLLREMGIQHVFDSRSLDFAAGVLAATEGRGVDVVINSLAGEFVAKSFEALASDGCFIEIGKRGIWTAEQASAVRPRARYEFFDINQLAQRDPALVGETLRRIVRQLDEGRLKPLPVQVHTPAEAPEAFRAMFEARHVGKVVIAHEPAQLGRRQTGDDTPTGTCLITGAYGGLGVLLARWLSERGRRHLVLLGRRAPDDRAAAEIESLERSGVRVLAAQCDVGSEEDLRRVLDEAAGVMPPISEVYHCAGALDDAALLELGAPRFATTRRPKVDGALHLDRLTRALPIRRFVLFSSYSSMFGSPGQANHAAANAYLDALAHARRARGLPAQSINWGPWAEVGAAAGYASRFASRGVGSFSPSAGLEALDRLLEADRPQTAVVPFDAAKWSAASPGVGRTTLLARLMTGQPAGSATQTPAVEAPESAFDVREALAKASSPRQRTRIMQGWLRDLAASVLRASPERVEETIPLKALGFDSLLSVEFRNRLEAQLGLQLPATLIWNHPTIAQIAANLLERLAEQSVEDAAHVGAAPEIEGAVARPDESSLAMLSEEDAAEELERRLQELEGRF